MSAHAISWALQQDIPAKPKLVLVVLANYAGGNGYCWFDAPRIAREASTSEGGLWHYLAALERNEVVRRETRKTKRGEERHYWLELERDAAKAWLKAETEATPEAVHEDLRTDEYREFLKGHAA